jgi:EAL domain-containing protein (putative c-di-GMP-specific phosphodiesterase class I)
MRRRADSFVRAFAPADPGDMLEQRFARAIERSWMAFQPIVDVANRRVFAYEALVRTDEESLRRPDILIAAAERLGRVHVLGRAVRSAVAAAACRAPKDALLFVNVHGLDLTDEDLFTPGTPLAELAPHVVLEITERTGLDLEAGPSRIAMLRRLGYRIAIDDLGAGYSSLDTLATLEPEIVKLDMSLIRDIERYPTKLGIVRAIAAMCRELGGQVVAEGVETEAERAAVVDAGVELLQGYLFAKPTREFANIAW